jgi:hypothetical protein
MLLSALGNTARGEFTQSLPGPTLFVSYDRSQPQGDGHGSALAYAKSVCDHDRNFEELSPAWRAIVRASRGDGGPTSGGLIAGGWERPGELVQLT